jgi:Skp family chaperone for outer membrane proteins
MAKMKKLIFLLSLALLPLNAGALELLLEENRGESGTIGYVDIDKVFKEYSGTTGAREEFLAEIKKKEDALNVRKTAIFTLKAELAKLRQEREFALTLPSLLETQRSVAEARADANASLAAARAAAEAARIQASTDTVTASTDTAAVPLASTDTLPSNIVQPVQPAAAEPAPQQPPQVLPGSLPGLGGIDMPGIAKVPVSLFKFSISTSVPEIDAALEKKGAAMLVKEEELRQAQRQSERELLEYESRRTEILLGRIYVALKELAIKEEVSVIVDKRNILYGQNAVDLTEKLLKRLEDNGL